VAVRSVEGMLNANDPVVRLTPREQGEEQPESAHGSPDEYEYDESADDEHVHTAIVVVDQHGEPVYDEYDESADDEHVRAAIVVVDHQLGRVAQLTEEARELVEELEARRRVEAASDRAVYGAARVFGVGVGVYALAFDELENIGLIVITVGLFFYANAIKRWSRRH
jgi:hypothetical protein